MIKRTQEGLEWPIDRKINHDLRKWPPNKKNSSTGNSGDYCRENKSSPVYQTLHEDVFSPERKD